MESDVIVITNMVVHYRTVMGGVRERRGPFGSAKM
jgi:hypothetical protein